MTLQKVLKLLNSRDESDLLIAEQLLKADYALREKVIHILFFFGQATKLMDPRINTIIGGLNNDTIWDNATRLKLLSQDENIYKYIEELWKQ